VAYALDVYQLLRDCTGRDDLARLGAAIFLHEKGPPGYEAGYGYTDSGPLPEWQGFQKQVQGVCSELTRFFQGKPVNAYTVREFWREEWKASDIGWPQKVWAWYLRLAGASTDKLAQMPIGRGEASRPSPILPRIPTVEDKLQGSLSPRVQEALAQRTPEAVRKALLIGLGAIGLAVVWYEVGRRA